jgi:ketosteroid isomerase-like protein
MGIGADLWSQMEALHNEQNIAGIPGLYTSDAEVIMPDGRYEGSAGVQEWLDTLPPGFTDFGLETCVLLESGDHIMAEWIGRMTSETGQRVQLRGATVATVRDGKFATYHDYFDPAELANQLGAVATG